MSYPIYIQVTTPTPLLITTPAIGLPGMGVPLGGSLGQVLRKKSNVDYDTEWGAGGSGSLAIGAAISGSTVGKTLSVGTGGVLAQVDSPNLSLYAPLDSPTFTGTVGGVTKAMVGLGNVPNLTFSGSNTGDETAATIKTKLGISVLTGSNTGDQDLSGKQDVLVSGTSIKTINGTSVLGSGNITVSGGSLSIGAAITGSTVGKILSVGASNVLAQIDAPDLSGYLLLAGRAGGQNILSSGTGTSVSFTQGTVGPGTVSVSGTTVTGVGTLFRSTFRDGDTITVTTTSGSETKIISLVTNDTSITTVAFTGTATGVTYTLAGGLKTSFSDNGKIGMGTNVPVANYFQIGAGTPYVHSDFAIMTTGMGMVLQTSSAGNWAFLGRNTGSGNEILFGGTDVVDFRRTYNPVSTLVVLLMLCLMLRGLAH